MTSNRITRIFIPIVLIIVWFVAAGVGGPYFGKISEVSSNDLSTFLPANAESTAVKTELEKFQHSDSIPAIVVFESGNTLTDEQTAKLASVRDALQATGVVKGEVSQPLVSDDGKAAFEIVPLASGDELKVAITKLQTAIADANPGMSYALTGPAMFSRDLNSAFAGIDGTLLLVALAVVFVILLVVYRSPVLPVVTLLGAMIALSSAIFVVWHFAHAGILQLNGQVQGILFILVIGAATDYSLLYIARYREELIEHRTVWQATVAAWKAAWEPTVAAGATVSLGLMCLLASDLGSNKALGPVGSIGIAFSVLIALTFLPSVLLLIGRAAFWPRKPKYEPDTKHDDYQANHPVWARVGALVSRHPRRLWVGITAVLLIAAWFVPQLHAQGVSQDNLVLGKSEARDGQAMLDRHFPSGSGSPVYVVTPVGDEQAVIDKLQADNGVDAVGVITTDSKLTTMPVGRQAARVEQEIRDHVTAAMTEQQQTIRSTIEQQLAGAPASVIDQAYQQAIAQMPTVDSLVAQANRYAKLSPKVVDGQIVLTATLKDAASSVPARDTVTRLRAAIQPTFPGVKFGGVSAIQLDTNTASRHDLMVIIPLILLVITIVLMLLLRSIVAPLVLLATTVLSFAATIGIAALLFNNVWHFAGADPSVVIFGFVFLVALGIDYNIFLMTRVREETAKNGVRRGTIKALVVTGGVITSAGIVLAATFAALYVIPILFLAQIAFIVSFGVLLDTLIVRSLLVPALTLEIGWPMWWPSRLWKQKQPNTARKK